MNCDLLSVPFEDAGLSFADPASAFTMCTDYLEILLQCRLWLRGQGRARESEFLTSSQVLLLLTVHGPHFEQQSPGSRHLLLLLKLPLPRRCHLSLR